MPRHNFTRTGKLIFRVRSVRNSILSRQQNRRYQEVLRRNAHELALIHDLFRRNNQYIREHHMDPDFARVGRLSPPEFVDTLLANTDGMNGRIPMPQDRQESYAGQPSTGNAVNGYGPPAEKAEDLGAQPDNNDKSSGDAVHVPDVDPIERPYDC